MTTLFLIRHGLTAVTGSRLYGRTGGIHLDERLEGVRLAALYSSPLERCTETVQPLATARGLEIRTSDALIEMDAGDWTGRTLPSLRRTKLWNTVQRSPSRFQFPAGESFVEAEARLLNEIEQIVTRHPRGRVVVGTHGDLVGMLISHYAGAHLDQFQRVTVDPASVSVVHLGEGIPRILLVNDTGNLRRFAPDRRERGASRERPRSSAHARDGQKRKLRG